MKGRGTQTDREGEREEEGGVRGKGTVGIRWQFV